MTPSKLTMDCSLILQLISTSKPAKSHQLLRPESYLWQQADSSFTRSPQVVGEFLDYKDFGDGYTSGHDDGEPKVKKSV